MPASCYKLFVGLEASTTLADLPGDDNMCSQKQFSKDRPRRLEMVADLSFTKGLFSGATAATDSHHCKSLLRASSVRRGTPREVDGDFVAPPWIPWTATPSILAHKGPVRIPSPVAIAQVKCLLLWSHYRVASSFVWLHDPGRLPLSDFLIVSEYLPRFRDWLDGRRKNAIRSFSSFRGRSMPAVVIWESLACRWPEHYRAVRPCEGGIILVEIRAAFADMQLICSTCQLGYVSDIDCLLSAVRYGSYNLFRFFHTSRCPNPDTASIR